MNYDVEEVHVHVRQNQVVHLQSQLQRWLQLLLRRRQSVDKVKPMEVEGDELLVKVLDVLVVVFVTGEEAEVQGLWEVAEFAEDKVREEKVQQ